MPKRIFYKYFKTQKELERFKRLYLPKNAYKVKAEIQYKTKSHVEYCSGYTLRYMVNKD